MRLLAGMVLGLIFATTLLPVLQVAGDSITDRDVMIRYWRADPDIFEILEVKTLPVYSQEGLPIFGETYILWSLNASGNIVPVLTHFKQGEIVLFRIFDTSEGAEWFYSGSELLLVENLGSETKIIWLSAFFGEKEVKLPYPTDEVMAAFHVNLGTPLLSHWVIQFTANRTETRFSLDFNVYGIGKPQETRDRMLDTWMLFSLYLTEEGKARIDGPEGENLTEIAIDSSSQLGLLEVNPENPLRPHLGIFNLDTQTVYDIATGENESLPAGGGLVGLVKYGQTSSLVRTREGDVYEYRSGAWQRVQFIQLKNSQKDLIFIDISLALAVGIGEGISIQFFGEDEDGDGLPSIAESYYGTDPGDVDSDRDLVSDLLEVAYGTNPREKDLRSDLDGDGLDNLQEYQHETDPLLSDTDFGGASDGFEIKYSFDPHDRHDDATDPDNDGLTNAVESRVNTNPSRSDTDSDGIPDGWEYKNNLNPLNPLDADEDYDGDGISNYREYLRDSNPLAKNLRLPFEGNEYIAFGIFAISASLTALYFRKEFPDYGKYSGTVKRSNK